MIFACIMRDRLGATEGRVDTASRRATVLGAFLEIHMLRFQEEIYGGLGRG